MMLELRKEDGVAALEVGEGPGIGHEVDAFGGAASEDDFLGGAGIDEFRRAFARGFVGAGGPIAQLMDAAVNIGIVVLVVADDGIEDWPRLLAARRAIEVDQRVPIDLLVEDREILPQPLPINCACRLHCQINLAANWAPT